MQYIKGITDDDTTRTARDLTTGKSVIVDGNLTYPEWKKQYAEGVAVEGQAYKPVSIDVHDARKDECKGNINYITSSKL